MVMEVFADVLEVMLHVDSKSSQVGTIANAGVEENGGCANRASRENDLLPRSDGADWAGGRADFDGAELLVARASGSEDASDAGVHEDAEIGPLANAG